MKDSDQFRFVSLLALELENGDISLPSLPDVVMKIRKLLESDDCDFERISRAVSLDPVLVSRLFVFANSAYHNRADIKIDTLDAAIGRLGFEVVRNTAMSLTMKQLYSSDKRSEIGGRLRSIWARGMKMSCMAFALTKRQTTLNEETAYLCGLLNEIGKLYILTKAGEFPKLISDHESLAAVMEEWNPQITKSIIESWGFSDVIAESADPQSYVKEDPTIPACFSDIIYASRLLLDGNDSKLTEIFASNLSCQKLAMNDDAATSVMADYRDKLQSMQSSLA